MGSWKDFNSMLYSRVEELVVSADFDSAAARRARSNRVSAAIIKFYAARAVEGVL